MSVEGETVAVVRNVYMGNLVEVITTLREMCHSAAHLQLHTHPLEPLENLMKTAYFTVLESKARERILRGSS